MPRLIERLSDEDGAVRYWAATGLANLGAPAGSAEPFLRARLTDESPDVRIAVAQALCQMGRIDLGLPTLIEELKHDDPWLRLAAANAIDYGGEKAGPAVPAMRSFMASDDRENLFVRWVFGNTLRTLKLDPKPR
jgi:HEAT repeat protein